MTLDRPTLHLRRAEDGAPALYPTEVVLRADARALHVRFHCRDDHRWATFRRRDEPLWQEEVVEVFLAPGSAAPKAYFELEVNPLGTLFDARVHNPHGRRDTLTVDTTWDGPGITSRAGAAEGHQDWWAELTLPWADLLPAPTDKVPDTWRIGFFRVERPGGPDDPTADEYTCWSPALRRPADFHVPDRLGYLLLDDARDPRAPGTDLPAVRLQTSGSK